MSRIICHNVSVPFRMRAFVTKSKPSKSTAYHEAGHAIAAARIGFVFNRVVLGFDSSANTLGAVHRTEWPGAPPWPKWMQAMVLICGPLAEARCRKQSVGKIWLTPAAESDARSLAGLELTDDEIVAHRRNAGQLLNEQWSAVARTAADLLTLGELSFQEIEAGVIWPTRRNNLEGIVR
jgi:hypothetical protein